MCGNCNLPPLSCCNDKLLKTTFFRNGGTLKRTFACIVFLSFILFLITSIGSAQSKDHGMAIFLQAQELQENSSSEDDLKIALKEYEKALGIFEKVGADYEIGFTLNAMGSIYQSWGQYAEALECYEKALFITRKIGEELGEAATLNNLGLFYKTWGQYRKSAEYYENSLAITRKIGDIQGERATLNNLEKVKRLIEKGPDLNGTENRGNTPLASASTKGEVESPQHVEDIKNPSAEKRGDNVKSNAFLVLLAVIIIVSIKAIVNFTKKKRIQKELELKLDKERQNKMYIEAQAANRLEKNREREFLIRCFLEGPPVLEESPIILKNGEEAYYHSTVNVYQQKTVTKTHRLYGGTRINVGLPLYFGGSTPISTSKEVVSNMGYGELVVTNQRIVIMGSKVNYSIKLSDINDFDISGNNIQIFSEGKYGGRLYSVNDGEKLNAILSSLLKGKDIPKLIGAAYLNRIDIVKKLLEHGIDINTTLADGSTALMSACDNTDDRLIFVDDKEEGLALVQLLIEKGAAVNATKKGSINALMIAAASGYMDAVKLLLEHGAEINAKDGEGRTALMYAESGSQENVVSFLLSHGALRFSEKATQ